MATSDAYLNNILLFLQTEVVILVSIVVSVVGVKVDRIQSLRTNFHALISAKVHCLGIY